MFTSLVDTAMLLTLTQKKDIFKADFFDPFDCKQTMTDRLFAGPLAVTNRSKEVIRRSLAFQSIVDQTRTAHGSMPVPKEKLYRREISYSFSPRTTSLRVHHS